MTSDARLFWPKGHNLNKLGRDLLDNAAYQISRLYALRFQKKICSCFPYINPGWGHFWPQKHNLNKLGRGPLGDATYQISRLYARQEDFESFHLENLFLASVT